MLHLVYFLHGGKMFDILEDILYKKTGQFIGNPEKMEEFSSYMIQRWISMYSDYAIAFLNSTVNTLYGTLDDDEMYEFMLTSLPKYKYKRIPYIKSGEKKEKGRKPKDDDRIACEENYNKLKQSMKFVFGESQ